MDSSVKIFRSQFGGETRQTEQHSEINHLYIHLRRTANPLLKHWCQGRQPLTPAALVVVAGVLFTQTGHELCIVQRVFVLIVHLHRGVVDTHFVEHLPEHIRQLLRQPALGGALGHVLHLVPGKPPIRNERL